MAARSQAAQVMLDELNQKWGACSLKELMDDFHGEHREVIYKALKQNGYAVKPLQEFL